MALGLGLSSAARAQYGRVEQWDRPRLKFGAIGLNHSHIIGQCNALLRGGGALTKFHAVEDDLAAEFAQQFPQAKRVRDEREIIEDREIALVASASIPDERVPLGIRVMQAGKDFMADKPGITSLAQLAQVKRMQAETGRIYSIAYSERFDNHATVKASELVAAGAIGDVVQTMGLGPHRLRPETRPEWFWDKARFGGILTDIGSHQIDQFLHFTGSTQAEVTAAQIANFHHQDRPHFEDFGDIMLRGDKGAGYCRVDWFTPDGLDAFGDGRLTIIGSDGYIELRKYTDIAGRSGGSHLFLVDNKGVTHVQPGDIELPYGRQLVDDVLNRTETAMTQAHCFLATELALKAQRQAIRIG
jgi:predicted dehydrogenase